MVASTTNSHDEVAGSAFDGADRRHQLFQGRKYGQPYAAATPETLQTRSRRLLSAVTRKAYWLLYEGAMGRVVQRNCMEERVLRLFEPIGMWPVVHPKSMTERVLRLVEPIGINPLRTHAMQQDGASKRKRNGESVETVVIT